jgi:hypothetical protein
MTPQAPPYSVAKAVQRYTALLQEEVTKAGGWPKKLRLPEPATLAEREALALFLASLEEQTGAPITVTLRPEFLASLDREPGR